MMSCGATHVLAVLAPALQSASQGGQAPEAALSLTRPSRPLPAGWRPWHADVHAAGFGALSHLPCCAREQLSHHHVVAQVKLQGRRTTVQDSCCHKPGWWPSAGSCNCVQAVACTPPQIRIERDIRMLDCAKAGLSLAAPSCGVQWPPPLLL